MVSEEDAMNEAEQVPGLCLDRDLDEEFASDAAERAIHEREGNRPHSELRRLIAPERVVSFTGKRWRTGRTLLVHFLDGEDWARDRAFGLFNRWTDVVNLPLARTKDRAASDIRVSFEPGGSWSYIGTDNASVPKDRPTMRLGWLTGTRSRDDLTEWQRVCLHEFGHVLSFGHEHQHPRRGFQWMSENVYHDYSAPPNNWPRETITQQVINKYAETLTNFSAFDRASIMLYPIPVRHVMDPADAVGMNTKRSFTDRRYAALWYPYPSTEAALREQVERLERAAAAQV